MASWEYKVVYMDFRGRASVEGDESFIAKEERRSAFARRVMNTLGAAGWEMVGVQPLWPAETSYLIFKREGTGDTSPGGPAPGGHPEGHDHPHHGGEHDHPHHGEHEHHHPGEGHDHSQHGGRGPESGPPEAPTQKLDPPVL